GRDGAPSGTSRARPSTFASAARSSDGRRPWADSRFRADRAAPPDPRVSAARRSAPPPFRRARPALGFEALAPARQGVLRFAGTVRTELERAERLLHVVLVELRELEPNRGIIDFFGQVLEVVQRGAAIAARLVDLAAHAQRRGPGAALE